MREINFWYFFDIFLKRWKLILGLSIIVGIIVGEGSRELITPVYRSAVSLYFGRVTDAPQKALEKSGVEPLATSAQLALGVQLIQDYRELIYFDVITEGVLDEIARTGDWHYKLYKVDVQLLNQSRIMRIFVDSDDPAYSQLVANIYAEQFIKVIQDVVGIRNAQVIEEAGLKLTPIRPRILFNAFSGFLASSLFLFLFFAIRSILDRTVRTPQEFSEKFGVPVIGIIHRDFAYRAHASNPILFASANQDTNRREYLTEDFRTLRINLLNKKLHEGADGAIFALTSASAKSGQTFCVSNLAVIVAAAGHRVLVVECSPRKNGLQNRFGKKTDMGLMDVLHGDATFDSTVKRNMSDRFWDVLFFGNRELNSARLLISVKFRALMATLRTRYDYVFLDVAGHLGNSDVVTVGGCTDGVLLLVRANRTQEHTVVEAIETFQRASVKLVGVILNGVEAK